MQENCSWQVGSFGGIVDEVQALKRDKNVLMLELVRLRQQQQVKAYGCCNKLLDNTLSRVCVCLGGVWLIICSSVWCR